MERVRDCDCHLILSRFLGSTLAVIFHPSSSRLSVSFYAECLCLSCCFSFFPAVTSLSSVAGIIALSSRSPPQVHMCRRKSNRDTQTSACAQTLTRDSPHVCVCRLDSMEKKKGKKREKETNELVNLISTSRSSEGLRDRVIDREKGLT